MLTVPEAARLANRNPETIRRWIRSGRLGASKVGTQHVIEEGDLEVLIATDDDLLSLPEAWRTMEDGRPQLNWVRLLREERTSH